MMKPSLSQQKIKFSHVSDKITALMSTRDKLWLLAQIITNRMPLRELDHAIWETLPKFAKQQGMLPLLDYRANEQDFEYLTKQIRDWIKRQIFTTKVRHKFFAEAQQTIQLGMKNYDIPCIWLKGSVIASQYYPQAYLRPMVDIDFLVPYEKRHEALQVAYKLGFTDPNHQLPALREKLHHYDLYGGVGNSIMVELHFTLLGYEHDELLPKHQLDWFLGQTVDVPHPDGWTMTSLKPEAHLLYLCAHNLIQHGENNLDLIHLYDIVLLLRQEQLDWELVVNKAIELRWAYAVQRTLEIVQHYFDTQFPDEVIERLQNERQATDFVTKVTRFQGSLDENILTQMDMLFRSATWTEKLKIIWDVVFPSPDYMQARYKFNNRYMLALYYPYRWFSQAIRLGRSIVAKRRKTAEEA